jgi:hypothetical protein
MRNTVKKTLVASLAALTLSAAVVSASPASAGGWGGWHHNHGGGYWGPGIAFGVLGLAAGAMVASQYECVRYRPVYDAYGNYVGQRAINVC